MTEDASEKPLDARATVPSNLANTKPPLGEIESCFRRIFETLEVGFCISDRLPGEPIDFRHVMANQAFQRQSGLEDPVGKTMRELVPTIDDETMAGYARVAETGKPEVFPAYALGKWFEIEAVSTGRPGQIAVLFRDITAIRQAEEALRKGEQRKAFLLTLSDALRTEIDPDVVGRLATRMVADYFNVDRCHISRLSREEQKSWVSHETRKPGLPSLEGEYNLADFPESMRKAETGTLVFRDVQAAAELSVRDKANYSQLRIGALISPILRKGERNYVFGMAITSVQPRDWSPNDAPFLEEIAELVWSAIERTRAECALRESEERQSFLLKLSDALRPLQDALAVQEVAARLLGEHLNASRAFYFGARTAANDVLHVVQRDFYTRPGMASMVGEYSHNDFGQSFFSGLADGNIVVMEDVRAKDLTPSMSALYNAIRTSAWVVVPLIKDGQYAGGFVVLQEEARAWSSAEVDLVKEVAERTWSSLERARAEAALRETEQRLQLATAAAGLFGWELDIATGRAKVSGDARAAIGFEVPPDEAGRLPHVHPDDADRVAEALRRSQRTGQPLFIEHRLVGTATGETVWVRVQGRALTEGKLIGVTQNIDAQKKAELAKNHAEEQFRLFVDNVREYALVQTDPRGKITSWNPGAEHLFGYTTAEMIGQPFSTLVAEVQMKQRATIDELVDAGGGIQGEHAQWLTRKDASRFWARWVTETIHDRDGRVRGIAMVMRDETERQESEETVRRSLADKDHLLKELERSNQDLAKFAYVLSHDLVGPSQSVYAQGELLLKGREGKLNDGQHRLIAMMTQTAEGMDRLVKSMLESAQIGHGMLKREAISLAEVIDQISVRLAGAIQESAATIHRHPLPIIEADRTQMEQLFQNLIANAIKYRKPGDVPIITISAENANEELSFAVRDNGQGVPRTSLEPIFEPLVRLHGQDMPGTGLGLAICRKIVERHGGRIWAESEGVGLGTTIRFTLPRSKTT